MSKSTRSVGEHVRRNTKKRIEYREKKRLEKGVRAVHEALYLGEYADAAEALHRRVVVPLGLTPRKIRRARDDLEDAGFAFDFFSTVHFVTHAREYVEFFELDDVGVDPTSASASKSIGLETSVETARKRLRNAFLTIENIAISAGLLRSELSNASRLEGFALELGVVWKSYDRELPDRVKLWGLDDDEDVEAVAVQGSPGSGKSMALGTLAEDRYAAGHKIMDMLDWKECENIFYDVPNQRDDLAEERRELDLPQWYEEIDGVDEPQVEVLLPLTPAVANWSLPYDVDDERFVARPFTIPASEVEKRAFKAFLTHTTTVQNSTLERALKRVENITDWTIADLATAIRETADDDKVADRLTTNLETLQESSFIRDTQDEHALDWGSIMRDTSTITCFSVAGMSDPAEKYMVMLYLVRSLIKERETDLRDADSTTGLPRLTTLWRELRLIIPPESKKTKDARIRELEGALIDAYGDLATLHRHDDIELIGDSQQFERQVHSDVRANFISGLTFKNKKPYVREFWKAYGADENRGSYVRRVATQFSSGDFAYLGESSVDERTFHSPCYMAPAMSHHIDTKEEDHGLLSRVEYLDHEKLRSTPWSAELPERFTISRSSGDTKPTRDEPVAFFAYHCLDVDDVDGTVWEWTDDVYSAYRIFARSEGLDGLSRQNFGIALSKATDGYERKNKMVDGDTGSAYFGLRLNTTGRNVLTDQAVDGVVGD